jgi:hypothetical protein
MNHPRNIEEAIEITVEESMLRGIEDMKVAFFGRTEFSEDDFRGALLESELNVGNAVAML